MWHGRPARVFGKSKTRACRPCYKERTMANVKLLLNESIKNVGRVGDIVEVSPGYARNYLLPKGLAVEPTPGNVKRIEARKQEVERQERERREQQTVLLKQLEGIEVTLERRAN